MKKDWKVEQMSKKKSTVSLLGIQRQITQHWILLILILQRYEHGKFKERF